jgi:hypothetical protein
MNPTRADFEKPFERAAAKLNRRRACISHHDLDVTPTNAAAPAGSERFHDGFFRGEPRRITHQA